MKNGVDYIGVGCGALIIDVENQKFFAHQRGKNVRNEASKWSLPGGGVEFGEKLKQALKREVLEEHGCEIIIGDELKVVDHIINNGEQHWVTTKFVAVLDPSSDQPKILEPEKCDDLGWFTKEEFMNLDLTEPDTELFDLLDKALAKAKLIQK